MEGERKKKGWREGRRERDREERDREERERESEGER